MLESRGVNPSGSLAGKVSFKDSSILSSLPHVSPPRPDIGAWRMGPSDFFNRFSSLRSDHGVGLGAAEPGLSLASRLDKRKPNATTNSKMLDTRK
jgi:hypothetical protein